MVEYIPNVDKILGEQYKDEINDLLVNLENAQKQWERDCAIRKINFLFAKDLIQYVGRGTKKIEINLWSRMYTGSVLSFDEVVGHLCYLATIKGYVVISKEFPKFIIECFDPDKEIKIYLDDDDV